VVVPCSPATPGEFAELGDALAVRPPTPAKERYMISLSPNATLRYFCRRAARLPPRDPRAIGGAIDVP